MSHYITIANPEGLTGEALAAITVATPATMAEAARALGDSDVASWWLDTADGSIIANKHVPRVKAAAAPAAKSIVGSAKPYRAPRKPRVVNGHCQCRMCRSGSEGLCPYGNG